MKNTLAIASLALGLTVGSVDDGRCEMPVSPVNNPEDSAVILRMINPIGTNFTLVPIVTRKKVSDILDGTEFVIGNNGGKEADLLGIRIDTNVSGEANRTLALAMAKTGRKLNDILYTFVPKELSIRVSGTNKAMLAFTKTW